MVALPQYFCQLNRSFAALHAALENRRVVLLVFLALLSVHTVLLGYSAYVHSPTLNEPGHLVAGLSYWKFGRFDLYSVNPPLVKMVAALPVMVAGFEEDWSGFSSGPGVRPEFAMGQDFVAANGERSFFLFTIARWACIPFSWLGAVVCFLWGRDLYSRQAGLVAAGIWCFESNIVAHASLITPDAHATALGLAACYTFWRWLKNPTWTQAALTGVVLGLAELAKTTLIVFFPLWPLMWIAYRWADRNVMRLQDWGREAVMLALRMGIGLYVLNLGYAFEGSLTRLKDYSFVSASLSGIESSASGSGKTEAENRFAESWIGELPVPLPKQYVVGIDLQRKDFESYGRPSYLRGEWRDYGWWYYYLYGCAIKVPLGLWVLASFALVQFLADTLTKTPTRTSLRTEAILLLFPAAVIFTLVSSQTGFNEHLRYVLPCFPFFFLWIGGNCLKARAENGYAAQHWQASRLVFPVVVTGCWFVASGAYVYPHSLSYFNESIGGPLNGAKHLLGSNLDWGQDLRYLKEFLLENPDAAPVHIAYHGNVVPWTVGFAEVQPWPDILPLAEHCSNIESSMHAHNHTPCYAVSISLLLGSQMAARDGVKSSNNAPHTAYTQARRLEPVARAGYSIWIFQEAE